MDGALAIAGFPEPLSGIVETYMFGLFDIVKTMSVGDRIFIRFVSQLVPERLRAIEWRLKFISSTLAILQFSQGDERAELWARTFNGVINKSFEMSHTISDLTTTFVTSALEIEMPCKIYRSPPAAPLHVSPARGHQFDMD